MHFLDSGVSAISNLINIHKKMEAIFMYISQVLRVALNGIILLADKKKVIFICLSDLIRHIVLLY